MVSIDGQIGECSEKKKACAFVYVCIFCDCFRT